MFVLLRGGLNSNVLSVKRSWLILNIIVMVLMNVTVIVMKIVNAKPRYPEWLVGCYRVISSNPFLIIGKPAISIRE